MVHANRYGPVVVGVGMLGVLVTMYMWWSDAIREAHGAITRRSSSFTCATE